MSYGWLKGNPHFPMSWQGGGPAGGGLLYDYGAPSGSGGDGSSTGVTAQWLFDEASGNIVDEVGGVTLSPTGTISYSQAATGAWANLTPGIQADRSATANYFEKASATAALHLNTDDAVIEYVYSSTNAVNSQQFFDFRDAGPGFLGYQCLHTHSSNTITLNIKAEDGTSSSHAITVTGIDLDDGSIHKVRIALDRSGNLELSVDGVSQGTSSLAAQSGKTIQCNKTLFFIRVDKPANTTFGGPVYELRFTVGNATNNSGP